MNKFAHSTLVQAADEIGINTDLVIKSLDNEYCESSTLSFGGLNVCVFHDARVGEKFGVSLEYADDSSTYVGMFRLNKGDVRLLADIIKKALFQRTYCAQYVMTTLNREVSEIRHTWIHDESISCFNMPSKEGVTASFEIVETLGNKPGHYCFDLYRVEQDKPIASITGAADMTDVIGIFKDAVYASI